MKSKILFYLILITLLALLIPAVHAQTFSVIHSFSGTGAEGGAPTAGVAIRGNALYGTTGANCGTVYQLAQSGSNWLFSTLATLAHNCHPAATASFGPDGHLYGTSEAGGNPGGGTVFKLTPPIGICRTIACYWAVTDVHDFDFNTEGYDPRGDLAWDQQGNIYGTTVYDFTYGWGTVYELTPSGNGYTESILHNFTGSGPDGGHPIAGVILDPKGNVYGTTSQTDFDKYGTVFEESYVIGVGWTHRVLYSFQGNGDGGGPSRLTIDSAGNLYGATSQAGNYGGTIFELSPSGNSWAFTVLYTFPPGTQAGGVVFGPDGALYGPGGPGAYQNGSIFKLTKTQNGWQYSTVHDFSGSDGTYPSNVAFDSQGNMYGTTNQGGTYNNGVVWMLKP